MKAQEKKRKKQLSGGEMFEKQVSAALFSYLKQFIANLNEEQIKLSIWSGDLVLKNLELQPTALDELGELLKGNVFPVDGENAPTESGSLLPFAMKKGMIKELRITVPWSTLDREPLCIEVSGLHIFLTTLRARPYAAEEENARSQTFKKMQLDRFEKNAATLNPFGDGSSSNAVDNCPDPSSFSSSSWNSSSPSQKSFLEQLLEKIVRNTLLIFRDIRISYELDYPGLFPSLATGLSVSIEEVLIINTDEHFHDRFVYDLSLPLCKRAEVLGFCITVFSGKKDPNMEGSQQPDRKLQENAIVEIAGIRHPPSKSRDESCPWCYNSTLLKVSEFSVQLLIPPHGLCGSEFSTTDCSISFDSEVVVNISFAALTAVRSVYTSIWTSWKGTPFRKFLYLLCDSSDLPNSPGLRRWKFAVQCVMSKIRSRKHSERRKKACEPQEMVLFCQTRRQYCELYKRSLQVPWLCSLTAGEVTELHNIEKNLSLDLILFLRSFARAELFSEERQIRLQKTYLKDAEERVRNKNNKNTSRISSFLSKLGWQREEIKQGKNVTFLSTQRTRKSLSLSSSGVREEMEEDRDSKEKFLHALELYWSSCSCILSTEINASALESLGMISSTEPIRSSCSFGHSPLALLINIESAVINALPNYYGLGTASRAEDKVSAFSPSFLERFDQQCSVTVKKVTVALNRDEALVIGHYCVLVGSVESKFTGIRSTPLLVSDSSSSATPFLNIVYSPEELSIEVEPATVVLYPNHELLWWSQEVTKGMERWNSYHSKDCSVVPLHPSSSSTSSLLFPSRACKARIRSLSVIIPLSHEDLSNEQRLSTEGDDLSSTRRSLSLTSSLNDRALREKVDNNEMISMTDMSFLREWIGRLAQKTKVMVTVPTVTFMFAAGDPFQKEAEDEKFTEEVLRIFTEKDIFVSCHAASADECSTPVCVDILLIGPILIHHHLRDPTADFVYLSFLSATFEYSALAMINDFLVNPSYSLIPLQSAIGVTPFLLHSQLWDLRTHDELVVFGNPSVTYKWHSETIYDSMSALCRVYFCDGATAEAGCAAPSASFISSTLETSSCSATANTTELGSSNICFIVGAVSGEFRNLFGCCLATVEMMEKETVDESALDRENLASLLARPHAADGFYNFAAGFFSSAHLYHFDLASGTGKTIACLRGLAFSCVHLSVSYNVSIDGFTLNLSDDVVAPLSFIFSSAASLLSFETQMESDVPFCSQVYTFRITTLCIDIPLLTTVKSIPNSFLYCRLSNTVCKIELEDNKMEMDMALVVERIEKREELGMVMMEYQILSASENFVGDVCSPSISANIKKTAIAGTGNVCAALVTLTGGQISIYFPLLFELTMLSEDPFYVDLLNTFAQNSRVQGFTGRGEEWKQQFFERSSTSQQLPVPDVWTIECVIKEVELFVATDCTVPIDLSKRETYFFMFLSQAEVCSRSTVAFPSTVTTVGGVHIKGLFYFPSYSPSVLSTFVNEIDMSFYQCVNNGKVSCNIKAAISENDEVPEMWFSLEQACALARAFTFNWSVLPPEGPVPIVFERYVMDSLVPKFIVVIQVDNRIAFSLKFENGLRFSLKDITSKITVERMQIACCLFKENRDPTISDLVAALGERQNSLGVIHSVSMLWEYPLSMSPQAEFDPSLHPSYQCAVTGTELLYKASSFPILWGLLQQLKESQIPFKKSVEKEVDQNQASNPILPFSADSRQQATDASKSSANVFQFTLEQCQVGFFDSSSSEIPLLKMNLPFTSLSGIHEKNTVRSADLTISRSEVLMSVKPKNLECNAEELSKGVQVFRLEKFHIHLCHLGWKEVQPIEKVENIVTPFQVIIDTQIMTFKFNNDHLQRLIAYASNEIFMGYKSITQGDGTKLSMFVETGVEDSTENSSPSPYLPHEVIFKSSDLNICFPLVSLHVTEVLISQTKILWKNAPVEEKGTEVGESRTVHCGCCRNFPRGGKVLCIAPELEVKGSRIIVKLGNEVLRLPDINARVIYPLEVSSGTVDDARAKGAHVVGASGNGTSNDSSTKLPRTRKESPLASTSVAPTKYQGYNMFLMIKPCKVVVTECFLQSLLIAYLQEVQRRILSLADCDVQDCSIRRAANSSPSLASFHGELQLECPSLDLVLVNTPVPMPPNEKLRNGTDSSDSLLVVRISCTSFLSLCTAASNIKVMLKIGGKCEVLDRKMTQIISLEKEVTQLHAQNVNVPGEIPSLIAIATGENSSEGILLTLQLEGMKLLCNFPAVDLLIELKRFYFQLNELASSSRPLPVTSKRSSELTPVSWLSKKITIIGKFGDTSLIIVDTTIFHLEDVEFKLELLNYMLPYNQDSVNKEICKLRFGAMALSDLSNTIQYISISSGDLKVEVGSIVGGVQNVIANHFEGYTFIAYNIAELQKYAMLHLELPKKISEGFERKVCLTIITLEARFAEYSAHPSTGKGYLRARLPAVVIRELSTLQKVECSLDIENASAEYFLCRSYDEGSKNTALSILDKWSASAQYEADLMKQTCSVGIRFGKFCVSIPTGQVLSHCSGSILKTLLAYTVATTRKNEQVFYAEHSELFSPHSKRAMDFPHHSATTSSSEQWAEWKIAVYLPEFQLNVLSSSCRPHLPSVSPTSLQTMLLAKSLSLEYRATPSSSSVQIEVQTINSSVHPYFFTGPFVGASARSNAIDPLSRKSVHIHVEQEFSLSSYRLEGLQPPTEKIKVIWRLNQFFVALSPEWLHMIRDEVLNRIFSVAFQLHREIQQKISIIGQSGATIHQRHTLSLPSREHIVLEGNSIVIFSDHCLSSNLILGGPYGMVLHFRKNKHAKVVNNLINLSSVPGVKIMVSPVGYDYGKLSHQCIIVEEGLTVNIINTPLYLGLNSLENVVLLGERSLFNVDKENVLSSEMSGSDGTLQKGNFSSPGHLKELVHRTIDVDASVEVTFTMWSKLDQVSLSTIVAGNYHSEMVFVDNVPGMIEYRDENGKVQVANLLLKSNSSPITDKDVTITMDVNHRKLEASEGGVSVVVVELPSTHLSFTMEQLRLLYRTGREVFKFLESSLEEFKDMDGWSSMVSTAAYQKFSSRIKSSAGSNAVLVSDMKFKKPFHSLLDLRMNAPSLIITLNHDLGGKVGFFSFVGTSCEIDGNRNLCSLICKLRSEVTVSDCPNSSESRVLLSCAPQLVSSYNWYTDGSLSVEASVTCNSTTLTVPLLTLTEFFRSHINQGTFNESFAMHNFLGRTVTVLWPSGESTVLESGSSTSIDQLYRASSCHVLLGDATDFIKEHPADAKFACACVDFAKVRERGCCRFSQVRRESLGVLDTVFRLRAPECQLHITSSVLIKNSLEHFTVELSNSWRQLPREVAYAPVDLLLLPLLLRVDGYEQKLESPLHMTWETLIGSFVALPESIFCENVQTQTTSATACIIADRAVRLSFLLAKPGKGLRDTETLSISLLLKRIPNPEAIRFSTSILQKCDVSLTFEALYSVINITGGDVYVSLGNNEELLLVGHNETVDLFPSPDQMENLNALKILFRFHSLDESEADYVGTLCLSDLPLPSERLLPLTIVANQPDLAVIVKHNTLGKLILQTVGIIRNSISNPLAIQFTRGSVCSRVVQVPHGSHTPIYIPLNPLVRDAFCYTDEPVYMKIAPFLGASQKVYEWSDAHFCNAPIPPTTLTTIGTENSIHVLLRSENVPSAAGSVLPHIEILSKWCLRNALRTPLEIKIARSKSEIMIIPPGEGRCLVEFPSRSVTNPEIQLRVLRSQFSSDWSAPFSLGALCAFGAVLHWKYRLEGNFAPDAELHVFEALAVPTHPNTPMERENFINLLLAPCMESSQCVVEIGADAVVPIVIENRIGIPVQVRQLPAESGDSLSSSAESPWAYFVPAHSDTDFSFDTLVTDPRIRIDLFDGRAPFHIILSGLGDLAVFEEVQKLGSFFVSVTLRAAASVSSYIVTITESPIIERRLLSSTRSVVHLDFLFKSLSVYVSSAWCNSDMKKSSFSHFLAMVKSGPWRLSCVDPNMVAEMTEKEIAYALQTRELDLFLLQIGGLHLSVLQNEKHIQGSFSVRRAEVLDCTSPHPSHPVVLSITDSKVSRSYSAGKKVPSSPRDQEERRKPCLVISFHLIFPRSVPSGTVCSSIKRDACLKVVLKKLSINVGELCVRLHDNFLYVLIAAVKRILESPVALESRSTDSSGVLLYSNSQTVSPAPRTYDYSLQNIYVSSIRFRLTLTRRVDGILNPFEDFSNLLGFIIPSIDSAPISFSSWQVNGYNVRSTQAIVFLTDVVWPAYRTPAILQFYKVLGSMEMIGNPVALISGWSRAVRFFISGAASLDPVSGAQDFFREATSSTLHSVHLLSHIGSRVTSKLAFDDRWTAQQETEEGEGELSSLSLTKSFANGIVDGIGGVFQKPVDGVRARGMTGLFSGVAGGMAGLLSRPLSGALRSVGNTAHFFSLMLEEEPASLASMFSVYLEMKRNFVPSVELEGSTPSRSLLHCHFLEGEFMTMQEFQFLGFSDSLKNCTASFFDSVVAHIGIHNAVLHGPPHVLIRILSDKDLYSWMGLMIIGNCARMWVKVIEELHKSHEEIPWNQNPHRFIEALEEGEGKLLRNNLTLEELKDCTSLKEFKENCPILFNRVSHEFIQLLFNSSRKRFEN